MRKRKYKNIKINLLIKKPKKRYSKRKIKRGKGFRDSFKFLGNLLK